MDIEIVFGATAPKLVDQLRAENLTASRHNLLHWQRNADAITRLMISGMINDSSASAVRRKLLKAIAKNVTPRTVK